MDELPRGRWWRGRTARCRSLPVALAVLVGLAACGGGGGGSGAFGPFETAEYRANYGLGAINAASAYLEGGMGQGVTVGVIDTGIDVDHPEFAGAIHPDSIDIVTDGPTFDDEDGHGTAVAGVIGARRDGALTHGVAFGSQLLVVRADALGSCGGVDGCAFAPTDVAEATDHAVDHGARVINYSLGGAASLNADLEAALERAVDAGVLLVLAAGNDGANEPTFPGRFAADPQADGLAITVGAVDAANQLASFSNRAGSAQDSFLVAPGVGILVPALGGGTVLRSGTSFAAPHVAGAAAAVLDAAPFLSGAEVAELLLDTATDLGAPGTDPQYGRGLVDLEAALSPQGSLAVPLGTSVGDAALPLEETGLRLGAAFGPGPELGETLFLDGYGRAYRMDLDQRIERDASRLDLHRWLAPAAPPRTAAAEMGELSIALAAAPADEDAGVALLGRETGDREGIAFRASLAGSSRLDVVHGLSLQSRFGLDQGAPGALAGLMSHRSLSSPYLGLARHGDGLALAHDLRGGLTFKLGVASERVAGLAGGSQGTRAVVGELSHATSVGTWLGLQMGSVSEPDRLLDADGGGALGLPEGASTSFVGLAGRVALPARIELFAQGFLGLTDPGGAGYGLIEEVSDLRSSSFGAGLSRRGVLATGDRLTLALAQPLRVEQGSATVDRPIARTIDGRVLRRADRVGLEPSGREIDLEAGYRLPLGPGRELQVNWLSQIEPGHDPSARPSHTIALRMRAGL